MKRALVLSGGGTKGAYEAGFIKAMHELNVSIDIVTGTSIGALNGALVTMGKYDELNDLWNNMNYHTVFNSELLEEVNNENVLSHLKSFIDHKGADIKPLKQLINDLLDEERLLSSSIYFGICIVEYPKIKGVMITKDKMEKDLIADYLIASASLFPIFPIQYINNQGYIDGGFYDNLPIDLALDLGADEIIVVDLNDEPTHPYYMNKANIIYTLPPCDLGAFLDFSRDRIDRNIRLGYQSAMKVFKHYVGHHYTFIPFDTPMFTIIYKEILRLERYTRTIIKNETNYINNLFINYSNILDVKDYLYIILDWFSELLNRDISYVYDYQLLINDLMIEFNKYSDKDYKMISFNEIINMPQVLKELNKKTIIGRIYHGLLYPFNELIDIDKILRLFPKEIIMAYFLYNIKGMSD